MKYVLFFAIFTASVLIPSHAESRGGQKQFPAFVYSKNMHVLSSEYMGTIEVLLDEGQRFKAGDVIFQFDTSLEEQQLAAHQAMRNLAKETSDIHQEMLSNYEQMYVKQTLSEELLLNKQLELLDRKISFADNSLKVAEIQNILDKKRFIAQYDGVVLARYTKPTEVVQQGQPIIEVLKRNSMCVKAKLPVSILGGLELSAAKVVIEGSEFPLEIDFVSERVEKNTNTVLVSYVVPRERNFRLNETVTIVIPEKHQEDAE